MFQDKKTHFFHFKIFIFLQIKRTQREILLKEKKLPKSILFDNAKVWFIQKDE